MSADSSVPPAGMTRRQWRDRQSAEPSILPSVLMVCTGNICRSPLAEVLLRARAGAGVRVHSAGTHALVDHKMTRQAQGLAGTHGAHAEDAEAHRGRYLQESILQESTLIFTMTREQRTFAAQLLPSKMRRIFTIREFARLADSLTDEELRTVADAAGTDAVRRLDALSVAVAQQRGVAPLAEEPDADDVVDPYRKSDEVYERSAQQLLPALDQVARVVAFSLN